MGSTVGILLCGAAMFVFVMVVLAANGSDDDG